ncbi:aldo/keto reductase [Streptomyces sp. NBC_00690]|uniref:aldo/keto reductase n=1 Tax=Streptomyces sp. NBC_00690 TaxID=2975808 RepID=UPI002E2877D0|nr:aldo/keto reductase [Streptomyces sp. NBC_00690]
MTSLHPLGTSGIDVFPLALGGNVFGWTADRSDTFAVLDAYAAAGGNFVDTADTYSAWVEGNRGGESETLIGEWLTARGNRADTVVATKVGSHPDFKGLSGATIRAAADASLKRLNTDYIDLYYTHFDDPTVPVTEIVTALDELVRAGKVRAIGASNLTAERLQESLDFSEREGMTGYSVLQPKYNLVSRDSYEGPLRDVASRSGIAAVPYSGLASGFLTGKYRPGSTVESARATSASSHLDTERGQRVLSALDTVAADLNSEIATVALAWLASRPTVIAPLASARTPQQLPALLSMADLQLTETHLGLLTEAST